jgi:hypothetical protein
MNLFVVEMRRALHRRVVRVLIMLALLGCAVVGVIAYVDSAGKSLLELHLNGQLHPAVMRDWWVAGTGDGFLSVGSFFLVLGSLVGGATVAGAEWRAGTVTTLLTWEPRRVRVHLSRTAACAILAFVISLLLQIVFLSALLPAVLWNGSTAHLDMHWWLLLVAAMMRTSLVVAIAATVGVALATVGRNTAFGLVVVFGWIAIVEGMIRGFRPGLARFLWGENTTIVLTWAQIDGGAVRRVPVVALATVALYASVIVAAGTLAFRVRDVASAS